MNSEHRTPSEIAKIIYQSNPGSNLQLYANKAQNAVGVWSHALGRVQVLASEMLDGRWAPMPELLINGEPCFKPEDWEPIG